MTHFIQDFAKIAFDYIVVGGGTAGLAVAARLSEDPQINVGVIEAGPSALNRGDAAITVPGRYGESIGSDYDWKFATSPQAGLNGRSLPWPRGRVLGGTSALNFMAWNRGHRKDYDAWEKLGNPGWGWEDLLCVWLNSSSRKAILTMTALTFFEARHSMLPMWLTRNTISHLTRLNSMEQKVLCKRHISSSMAHRINTGTRLLMNWVSLPIPTASRAPTAGFGIWSAR